MARKYTNIYSYRICAHIPLTTFFFSFLSLPISSYCTHSLRVFLSLLRARAPVVRILFVFIIYFVFFRDFCFVHLNIACNSYFYILHNQEKKKTIWKVVKYFKATISYAPIMWTLYSKRESMHIPHKPYMQAKTSKSKESKCGLFVCMYTNICIKFLVI